MTFRRIDESKLEDCGGLGQESCLSSSERRSAGSRVMRMVRWLVTLICVAILVSMIDMQATARMLLAADGPLVLAAVGWAFLDRGMMIAKWYPLLRVQDSSISFGSATRSYFAAGLAGLVIPTPISGDVLRAIALGRSRNATSKIAASIVMERFLGLIGSGLVFLIAAELALDDLTRLPYLTAYVAALIVMTFCCLALSLNGQFSARLNKWCGSKRKFDPLVKIRKFFVAYGVYRDRWTVLLVVGLLSFVEQFFPIVCLWILSQALNVRVSLTMMVVAVPLSMFVGRLPISVSGIGMTQGALVYLLGLFGVAAPEALSLSLAGYFLNIVVAVPGLFFWRDAMGHYRDEPVYEGASTASREL